MKKNTETDQYVPIFFKIAIGFLILTFIFPFIVNYYFSDWAQSGTFGDTFGALNAIFSGLALAGVIVTILIQRTELKNQRLELALQRNEMKETRKEFLLNRTTTLVYNQLDRFEKAISEFTIKTPHDITLKGNDAILYLEERKNFVHTQINENEENYKADIKLEIIKLLKIYKPNISEINKFSHSISNSVEVLKRLIYKTDIDINELNDLKNLFFVNIGFINMSVIEHIVEISDKQLIYLEPIDYLNNQLDIGAIMHAKIFLKTVDDFYKLKLTKENFEENKKQWINSLGNLEK